MRIYAKVRIFSVCWKKTVLTLFHDREKEGIKTRKILPYNEYNRYGTVSIKKAKTLSMACMAGRERGKQK